MISESNSEGKKFSNMFREKHGEDCNQFMDSSLMDAVTTHVTIARIEQKPILVYMSSPLHENEEAFQKLLFVRDIDE